MTRSAALVLCVACGQDYRSGSTPTGSSCGVHEIPLNGIDDDCDGWADEFGEGYHALTDELRVLTGTEQLGLGEWLDVGVDATGVVWLAAGGVGAVVGKGYFYPGFPGAVMARVQPGAEAVAIVDTMGATTDGLDQFGRGVTVGAFEGTAVTVWANDGARGLGFTGEEAMAFDHVVEAPFGVRGAADVDQDGFDELFTTDLDGAFVVLDGPVTTPEWSTSRGRITGLTGTAGTWPSNFGFAGSIDADLDGDGAVEHAAGSGDEPGRVWILDLGFTGDVALEDVLVGGLRGEPGTPGDTNTSRPAAGDANGDGYLDLLSGAPLDDDRAGVAYLVYGPFDGDRSLADADAVFPGEFGGDWCGSSLTFTPDLDGDGSDEPIVTCAHGVGGVEAPSRMGLFLGADARGVVGIADAAAVWVEEVSTSSGAAAVEGMFDLTDDGVPDLVVSAPGFSTTELPGAGAVYVVPGPLL